MKATVHAWWNYKSECYEWFKDEPPTERRAEFTKEPEDVDSLSDVDAVALAENLQHLFFVNEPMAIAAYVVTHLPNIIGALQEWLDERFADEDDHDLTPAERL